MTMNYDAVVNSCDGAMNKALSHLKDEFRAVRTGRAAPAMVENVQFDYYGSKQPLKNAATIGAQDASTITIKPFDATQLKAISKAIQEANLGFNPIDDGKMIRIVMPPMTEENRRKIAGQLKDMAERTKVTIRNARHEAIKNADQSFKDKVDGMSEDDHRALKDEIQNLTNKFNKLVDEALKSKTDDVMKL